MAKFFQPALARGPLDRHRILGPKCAVRVSPLCLGAMSLGDSWKDTPGMSGSVLNKEDSFKLLDFFYERGGNFIDTANAYEQSEMFIGEWAEKRGIRNELVLATKYTTPHKDRDHEAYTGSNYAGNSAKSLHVSLVDSLKKLRTDYIDILYVHWWDWATSVEEMMQSLNRVVQQGKVLYLGASDMPAWVVASANAYARAHGMAEFVVYQGRWNATQRDFEREIIPMCRKEGIALAPWGALGQGRLRTPEQIAEREKELGPLRGGKGQSEAEKATSLTLAKLGKEEFQGASVSQMALAYVFAKYPYVFPIVGGTKTSYIEDNIKAIQLKLTDEQIQKIEDTAEFDWGFPMNMILPDPHLTGKTNFPLVAHAGHIDWVKAPGPPSAA